MGSTKKPLISKNVIMLIFIVAFAMLYIASNSNNATLGTVGIALTLLNAVAVLVGE